MCVARLRCLSLAAPHAHRPSSRALCCADFDYPTSSWWVTAGLSDAGQFLLTMQRKRPEAYQDFLRERAVDPLHPGAAQPVARCVEHLCMLMVRVVERAAQAEGDAKIAHMEAAKLDLKSGKAKDSPSKDREKFLARETRVHERVPQHRVRDR